jgi:hypothetical protein
MDSEVILRTLAQRTTLTSELTKRLTHLQLLASMWTQGNVAGAFALLRQLFDANDDPRRLTVVADFLRVVDLRADGVNLEACTQLLPVLNGLVGLQFENHVVVGLRAVETLLGMFGRYAKQVRQAVPLPGGVDLSGEERLEKCQKFHDGITQTFSLMEALNRSFRVG